MKYLTVVMLSLCLPATAADAHTPQPGTPERKAIMDAVRPSIEDRLGPNIEFVVKRLEVGQGWALLYANPQRKGGGRIDPRRYFSVSDLDSMDGLTVTAVLQYRNKRWNLIDKSIGATDSWECESGARVILSYC